MVRVSRLVNILVIGTLLLYPVLPALALKAKPEPAPAPVLAIPAETATVINTDTNISANDLKPSVEIESNTTTSFASATPTATESNLEPEAAPLPSSLPAENTPENTRDRSYTALMRRLAAIRTGDASGLSPADQSTSIEDLRVNTAADLEYLLAAEKDRLKEANVPRAQYKPYIRLLKDQLETIVDRPPNWRDKLGDFFTELFGVENNQTGIEASDEVASFRLPPNPGSFGFSDSAAIKILPVGDLTIQASAGQNPATFFRPLKNWKDLITIVERADALDDAFLPVLADVRPDESEIIITAEIKDLAAALEHNPVRIFNYLRNTIIFEPYYGAKKGSVGCLRERLCNDTDAASLAIALLRSAGIPARYKKTMAVMSVDQLKSLLGVDETRTAFLALHLGDYPVFGLSSPSSPVVTDINIDQYDFSNDTHLALEWTYAEAFIRYDEQGGNYSSIRSFANAASTEAVRTVLRAESPTNSTYTKQQWLAIETLVKPYQRINRPILVDSANANWNPAAFFNSYLSAYSGALTPLEKYRADLLAATGQDIQNNLSTKLIIPKDFRVLPSTLPYAIGSGQIPGGAALNQETFSQLPAERRHQVTISLRREQNPETDIVLTHTFFGGEISNQPANLFYQGATPTDEQLINSYGGIHQTPAALVNITPVLQLTPLNSELGTLNAEITTPNTLRIGEALVTRFEHTLPILATQSWRTATPSRPIPAQLALDDKFSTAGNHEGIYLTLSRVEPDPTLDTDQKILLSGSAALAREYLYRIQTANDQLKQSLNYESHFSFARAVITQNRILNRVSGLPTTFDFKGLTIDATAKINDYSNTGHHTTHRETFRRLWGLQASYQEAKLFEDIAGLDSISTVKGLQHAYRNPQTYTVYTISSTTANYETLINGLNLSANTKQNLITDIRDRNRTVITPNQPVALGAFTGQLYISLSPQFTGNYAIGEQTGAKGGWSTDPLTILSYTNEASQSISYFTTTRNGNKITYQDNRTADGITCKLPEARHNQLIARPDWLASYGFPCSEDTLTFGAITHTYIHAANAVKFFSANQYDIWVYRANAQNLFLTAVSQQVSLSNPRLSVSTFIFHPITGTYAQDGVYGAFGRPFTIFFEPTSGSDEVNVVYGDIKDKLHNPHYNPQTYLCAPTNQWCGDKNFVLAKLGFPTTNQQPAAESFAGNDGEFQDFVGGQVYVKTSGFNKTYYVPGVIASVYNDPVYAINGQGGSGGTFGFPAGDPYLKNNQVTLKQRFENEGIAWNQSTGQAAFEYASHYYCDEIDGDSEYIVGKAFLHGFWDGGGSLVKGAVLFGGTTLILGSAIDFIFGTHGGATIAAWSLIGGGVIVGISEVYRVGVNAVFAGVDSRIQYEFEHSNCNARKAYLLAKYVPQFSIVMLGIRDLARRTPQELKGITAVNNIFTASRSEVLPRLKSSFIQNLGFFDRVFRNGERDRNAVIEQINNKAINEIAKQSKINGRPLTEEETSLIISRLYADEVVVHEAVKLLKWKKLVNTSPNQIIDSEPFPLAVTGRSTFIVTNGKIRDARGYRLSGSYKVVINDNRVYYGKVSNVVGRDYSHTQFLGGQPVDGGFMMKFNSNGVLVKYNWGSGHYQTPEERTILLEYFFQKSRVDTSRAVKVDLNDPDLQ